MPEFFAQNSALVALLELGESLGVDRTEVLSRIDMAPALGERVGRFVPAGKLVDATEVLADLSNRPDFGLMRTEQAGHRQIGPLGLLYEQAESIAAQIEFSRRFLRLQNNAIQHTLREGPDGGTVQIDLLCRGAFEPRHYVEALLGRCVKLVRLVLGPRWVPKATRFRHDQISPLDRYRPLFGDDVRFGQDANEIECTSADLQFRIEPTDPELKAKVLALLSSFVRTDRGDLSGRVSNVIRARLSIERPSLETVAAALAVSSRTLQRRLSDGGTSFEELLAEVRIEIARYYLNMGTTTLQLASALGFSEQSAASRFLRQYGLRTTADAPHETASSGK